LVDNQHLAENMNKNAAAMGIAAAFFKNF